MIDLKVGECCHFKNGFICSNKPLQNYPCPYSDKTKCKGFCAITSEMARDYKTKGYYIIKGENEQ